MFLITPGLPPGFGDFVRRVEAAVKAATTPCVQSRKILERYFTKLAHEAHREEDKDDGHGIEQDGGAD